MAISTITAWLNGPRDFAEGVELLKAHGKPDAGLLFVLGLGRTSVTEERLQAELRKLGDQQLDQARRTEPAPRSHAPKDAQLEDPDPPLELHRDLPAPLLEIRRQISRWYQEERYLRAQLRRMPGQDTRYQTADRIMELYLLIKDGWRKIDHWRAFGTLPQPKPTSEVDTFLEVRRLRSYISRVEHGHRTATKEKPEQWKARLRELENPE